MRELLEDIESRLSIKISEDDIKIYSDGATEAIVFSIRDTYLIKKTSPLELNVYQEFFSTYKGNGFQKLYYINYDLSYACLSFIKGDKYTNQMSPKEIIHILYQTTSNYKKISYDRYGYLFEDHKSWSGFLRDEVESSLEIVNPEDINRHEIDKHLMIISNYQIDSYLLHGDFGTHNFIFHNHHLYYIDPMGLVGDPIYDFYFAIFSDSDIFKDLELEELLEYYDRDLSYKKSMMYIAFVIRIGRAYKYDKDHYRIYLNYLEKFHNK